MSNPSTPFGFRYLGLIDGSPPNFGIRTVLLSPTNASKIYGGDVAKAISAGYYDVAAAVPGGGPVGGIFLDDFIWQSVSQQQTVRQRAWLGNFADIVAGGTLQAKIVCNPGAYFEVRSLGTSGAAVPQSDVGQNANFNVGAGPGNNLISTMTIDETTFGVDPALPFSLYELETTPGVSDPTATYNLLRVKFNNLAL